MKTLADIRRRAVAGTRLEVVAQTKRPVLVGTVRTITDGPVCSRHGARPAGDDRRRCYDWTGNTTETEGGHCTNWPKASQTRIIDADTFEYDLHPGPGVIRLRFLPPATGCAIHPVSANPFCDTCRDHGNPHPFDGL